MIFYLYLYTEYRYHNLIPLASAYKNLKKSHVLPVPYALSLWNW